MPIIVATAVDALSLYLMLPKLQVSGKLKIKQFSCCIVEIEEACKI